MIFFLVCSFEVSSDGRMNSDSEMNLGTFTLYFLGYDHSGGKETAEEKKESRFNREGKERLLILLDGL